MEKKGRAKGGGSSDADRASNLKEYALMDEALRRLAFSEHVPLKEDQQQEGGANAKARPKMRKGRKQLQKKEIGGADTKVKDGDEWDCWHCSNEDVSRLNKARLLMLYSKNAASCEHCQEDSSTNQQASGSKGRGDKEEEEEEEEEKKKKKKKKKKKGGDTSGAAAKDQTKVKNSDIWVCLKCSRQFCGGADSSKPEGHVKLHCYENRHWWAAHYDDPTLIYCFKCRVEVVVRITDVSLSQKKEKTEASYEPKATKSTKLMEGMGSNNPAQISSPSDHMDIPEMDLKLSLPIAREEGKGASDPGEVSSPPSWDWGWDSGSDWDEETTTTTKLMKGMGSDDPAQISPPSDQMAIPEMDLKLSPPIAREENKGTSDTGEVSSPPSDKTEINQLSRPIDNQDIAISGSAATSMNVIKGLPNIGNSCFVNVMLQNLLGIDSLRCKILGSDLWMGPRVACLKQLFVETSTSYDAGVPLNPEILFAIICQDFPEFSGGTMHDNAELFGRFLGSLHNEETDSWQISMDDSNNGKVTTLVDSMFRGQECSTVSSRECPHESPKSQGFCLLQLTLPQLQDSIPVSIEDCFALYTKPDLLPAWHCEECTNAAKNISEEQRKKDEDKKVYRVAEKRNLITRDPDILVVSLNRYAPIPNGGFEKLEGHVHFKEMLDMQPYMDQRSNTTDNNIYRLVGVTQHIGTLQGGHYIAYVRAAKMEGQQEQGGESKSWFCASDSEIRKASLQEVLGCEAYILVYERCSPNNFLSSANVTGEESQLTNTDTLAQTGAPIYGSIPPPPNEDELWEHQRYRKRDMRKEEELAKKDARVAKKIWVFIDGFIISGDTAPCYRFLLTTMIEKGFGSRELNIPYSHLLSHSKDLAMEVCNNYHRLRVKLTETARVYMQKLVEVEGLNVTESARKLMQHLELKFLEMPKQHEELRQCLSTDLLRKVDVFGHEAKPITIPVPEKCALVQDLIAYVLSNHRVGYSWAGDFDIGDIDVYDGRVVITEDPQLFEIQPQITDDMIVAMEKDFLKIVTAVLKRFSSHQTYVPYYKTFTNLLSGIHHYATLWSNITMAEALREWIQHHPFLKVSMARANLLCGIHSACRAYDAGDDTAQFKEHVEIESSEWTKDLLKTKNQMLLKNFGYKDPPEDRIALGVSKNYYYQEQLEFLFEYARHLAQHGTECSFEHRPLARRGDGPRKQLMQSLDELELAGAYRLELAVDRALFHLIRSSAMNGMLYPVWDCYKKCNSSYRGSR